MVTIIKDTDLYEKINDYDVILIGTNINCSMSQGFQRDIMLNFPFVQEKNMKTKYGDKNKLGTILECDDGNSPIFVLLYITEINSRPDLKNEYLNYYALEKCLKIINILYKGKKVASTIIGASEFDGNGKKDLILELLKNLCSNIDLTLYDYKQLSKSEKLKKIREKELAIKQNDINAYYEAVKKRKKEADERFKKNGHARY